MEKIKVIAVLGQFEGMKNQANELLQKFANIDNLKLQSTSSFLEDTYLDKILLIKRDAAEETKALLETYNNSCYDTEKMLGFNIDIISYDTEVPQKGLRQLIVNCDKIIRALSATTLSTEEIDKLNYIRKEVSELCENLDVNFEKNLNKAIQEAEKGQFLGSALITSRVVEYILDKFDGERTDEKIEFLISKGIMDKERNDVKEAIIKASRKARIFLSHRIDTFVESSDALALLGDCVKLLGIYKKLSN